MLSHTNRFGYSGWYLYDSSKHTVLDHCHLGQLAGVIDFMTENRYLLFLLMKQKIAKLEIRYVATLKCYVAAPSAM